MALPHIRGLKSPQFGFSVGRIRVTSAASPSEGRYIQNMRNQTKDLNDIIKKVMDHVVGVTPHAIIHALEPIYDRSQELVPKDTRKLMKSGFIEVNTEGRSGNVRALIGYARFGKPQYAAFVHEMVHIPHARGESAKFLEIAINEKIGNFDRRLTNYMRQFAIPGAT